MADDPLNPEAGTSKEEPFIGPIPPDPKTGTYRRFRSRSFSTDDKTGKEFVNTWDFRDMGDQLQTNVGGAQGDAIDKFAVHSSDPEVIRHFREMQRQAIRAAYYERRVLNAEPIPKPTGRKSKPRPAAKKSCPECEGTGLVWFGDFQEPCSRCGGGGTI